MEGGAAFDGSFKIYVDPKDGQAYPDDVEAGRNGGYGLEMFSKEVEMVKEDINGANKLYSKVQDLNEEIKIAQNAKAMKELRARLNADLDHLLKLAKQINKKFDGLVRANAAQRKVAATGSGVCDDQTRANMISDLGEDVKQLMRKFQGLRANMETDHRQLIESRYFGITREKATAEAIDNLIASEVPESPLHHAMQEHGRGPVLDAVAEIQERRDTMKETRKSLMGLHQILLGIATPVVPAAAAAAADGQIGGSKGGCAGPPSPVENYPVVVVGGGGHVAAKSGTGGLNDYEKETRNQAYIAIVVALVILITIIVLILRTEYTIENGAAS
ncbi:hypothetical protein ABFX02_13G112900 [Erythranthe guttata]